MYLLPGCQRPLHDYELITYNRNYGISSLVYKMKDGYAFPTIDDMEQTLSRTNNKIEIWSKRN